MLHVRAATADGFLLTDSDTAVDRLLAKTSGALLVSVETIEPEVAKAAERGLSLIVPAVDPIVVLAPGGGWPGGYGTAYPADEAALSEYAALPDRAPGAPGGCDDGRAAGIPIRSSPWSSRWPGRSAPATRGGSG